MENLQIILVNIWILLGSSSTTSSGGASLQQQPHVDATKAVFNQAGNQSSGQYQYQQAQ